MQLTSLKSPGCFKRCELEGRQTQGDREEVGETEGEAREDESNERNEGESERERERERASGGRMKVNVTSAGEGRGVFDPTSRDSKTLQLALLLALTCHCTVPCEKGRGRSPAALHTCYRLIFSPLFCFIKQK